MGGSRQAQQTPQATSTHMPPPQSHPPRPQPRTPSRPSGASKNTDGDGDDDEDEEASVAGDDRPLLRWNTTIFKSYYNWYVPHFHLAPEEAINTWWDKWKKAFRFRKGEAEKMRDGCLTRATKRLRELFNGIREKGYPGEWIPDNIFKCLKEYWALEEYQTLKRTNKSNRASSTGGSLHTWGISHLSGHSGEDDSFFNLTQIICWQQLYDDEIKRLEEERAALIAVGCPEPPIDYDAVWFRIAGGRKRGRVYERGKVLSGLKPPVYDSDDVSTASGPVDMWEQVTLLNRELTQQAKEHRQENMQAGSTTASSAGMPSPMPPPPLQHEPASATDQPQPDGDRSPHDDPDYI
ncbi:hypothetical protein PIB30_026446 [Stylosanthes scabra]|uniref:Uncharacterized protein n=1 Tax=Stylosanthes scabra TaxID=79078 RepID=A0ABU6U980_9FABA|nr:hypothetical protein [Stylosanthes scabra]